MQERRLPGVRRSESRGVRPLEEDTVDLVVAVEAREGVGAGPLAECAGVVEVVSFLRTSFIHVFGVTGRRFGPVRTCHARTVGGHGQLE